MENIEEKIPTFDEDLILKDSSAQTFTNLCIKENESIVKQYVYCSFLSWLGLMLAPMIDTVPDGMNTRLFLVLLGESEITHKSTCVDPVNELFLDYIYNDENWDDIYKIGTTTVSGSESVGEGEGTIITSDLKPFDVKKTTAGSGKGIGRTFEDKENNPECRPTLRYLFFDEMQRFNEDAARDGSNMVSILSSFLKDTSYENMLAKKSDSISVRNCHLSFTVLSTVASFQKQWTRANTDIGFGNRLLLIHGMPIKGNYPNCRIEKSAKYLAVKDNLIEILTWAHNKGKGRFLTFDTEVRENQNKSAYGLMNEFSTECFKAQRYSNDEHKKQMYKRLRAYAHKLALIYSAMKGPQKYRDDNAKGLTGSDRTENYVDYESISKAIEFMRWQLEIRMCLFPEVEDTNTATVQTKIRRTLSNYYNKIIKKQGEKVKKVQQDGTEKLVSSPEAKKIQKKMIDAVKKIDSGDENMEIQGRNDICFLFGKTQNEIWKSNKTYYQKIGEDVFNYAFQSMNAQSLIVSISEEVRVVERYMLLELYEKIVHNVRNKIKKDTGEEQKS